MTKNIKNIICVICASLIFIVALCLPFVFKTNLKTKNMLASADSVDSSVVFNGSNLAVYFSTFTGRSPLQSGSTLTTYGGMFLATKITPNSFNFALTMGFNNTYFQNFGFTIGSNIARSDVHWSAGSAVLWNMAHQSYGVTDNYYPFMYIVGTGFDANIKGVNISQTVCASGQISDTDVGASTRTLSVIVIRYFGADSDGALDTSNFIEFAFLNNNFNNSQSRFQNRTYYFTQVDSDSASYSAGYNDGYSVGNCAGESSGYKKGYSVGDNTGYSRGYNAGVADSNDYTFLGLMSSVVDAPIKAFTGLFNFEVFGVNLSDFVLGVSTLCIIIFVVRKLLL